MLGIWVVFPFTVLQVSFILITLIFQVWACLSVVFHLSLWKVCVSRLVVACLLLQVSHTCSGESSAGTKPHTRYAFNTHTHWIVIGCWNCILIYRTCIWVYINAIFHFLMAEDTLMQNLNVHKASLIGKVITRAHVRQLCMPSTLPTLLATQRLHRPLLPLFKCLLCYKL